MNEDTTPAGPPWAEVPAQAVIEELQNVIGAQTTEMAAMRAYIGQLHAALASVAGTNGAGAPVEAGEGA